ncbi:MAG TPA: sugar phosphate isomerase/epimerase family protein [Propionibacteriaceae bacterium]|nr:sugar phosphate isomerase/epimerase family protein [Propionibacteriaceae bacterium]
MITLSASTLGAPGESLLEVLAYLRRTGVPGLELRLSAGEIADPTLTRAQRHAVRAEIEAAGIAVTGIASYVKVAASTEDDVVLGALVAALDFASDLGTATVRVFPGAPAEPGPYDRIPQLLEPREEVNARAARRLNAVAEYASECEVVVALETHDSHPTGQQVAAILAQVDGPVGAIWDLMHPWRVGERLEDSWTALAPWLSAGLGSVQIKDADLAESTTPLLVGEGTLPTAEFAELLIRRRYAGTVTLEWERAWHPEAGPLDAACASARRWADLYWPDA